MKKNSKKFKKVLPVVLAASVATSNIPFAVFAEAPMDSMYGTSVVGDDQVQVVESKLSLVIPSANDFVGTSGKGANQDSLITRTFVGTTEGKNTPVNVTIAATAELSQWDSSDVNNASSTSKKAWFQVQLDVEEELYSYASVLTDGTQGTPIAGNNVLWIAMDGTCTLNSAGDTADTFNNDDNTLTLVLGDTAAAAAKTNYYTYVIDLNDYEEATLQNKAINYGGVSDYNNNLATEYPNGYPGFIAADATVTYTTVADVENGNSDNLTFNTESTITSFIINDDGKVITNTTVELEITADDVLSVWHSVGADDAYDAETNAKPYAWFAVAVPIATWSDDFAGGTKEDDKNYVYRWNSDYSTKMSEDVAYTVSEYGYTALWLAQEREGSWTEIAQDGTHTATRIIGNKDGTEFVTYEITFTNEQGVAKADERKEITVTGAEVSYDSSNKTFSVDSVTFTGDFTPAPTNYTATAKLIETNTSDSDPANNVKVTVTLTDDGKANYKFAGDSETEATFDVYVDLTVQEDSLTPGVTVPTSGYVGTDWKNANQDKLKVVLSNVVTTEETEYINTTVDVTISATELLSKWSTTDTQLPDQTTTTQGDEAWFQVVFADDGTDPLHYYTDYTTKTRVNKSVAWLSMNGGFNWGTSSNTVILGTVDGSEFITYNITFEDFVPVELTEITVTDAEVSYTVDADSNELVFALDAITFEDEYGTVTLDSSLYTVEMVQDVEKSINEEIKVLVTVELTEDGKALYEFAQDGDSITVTAAAPEVTAFDVDFTVTGKTYDGDDTVTGETSLDVTTEVEGETVPLVAGTDYTFKISKFSSKDAGDVEVTVTITFIGEYVENDAITETATATIAPKEVTVTSITAEDKTYDTTANATITEVVFDGAIEDETVAYSVTSATFASENAGEQTVTAIIALDDTNYSLSSASAETTATIEKATMSNVSTNVYGEVDALTVDTTSALSAYAELDGVEFAGVEFAGVDGYELTLEEDTDLYVITVSSTNYENFTVTLNVVLTDLEIPKVSVANATKTFDGKTISIADLDLTNTVDGVWTIVTEDLSANAGSHFVTLKFTPTDSGYITIEQTIVVTIEKATIALTASDISASAGTFLSSVEYGYSSTGLVSRDHLKNIVYTLSPEVSGNTLTSGNTYEISMTADVVDAQMGNYESISFTDGTLTVTSAGSSTGTGSTGSSGGSLDSTDDSTTEDDTTVDTSNDGTYSNDDGSTTTVVTDVETGDMTIKTAYGSGVVVEQTTTAKGEITADITGITTSTEVLIAYFDEVSVTEVAVIVYADGTEEIIKQSVPTDDGLMVTLSEDATIKVIDNAKSFSDVATGQWYSDEIAFVTAREIFNGTGDSTFDLTAKMSRAMLWTVLFRYDGGAEANTSSWYADAQEWSIENNISDGTDPNGEMTREQLATILYRYEGSPAVYINPNATIDSSSWAEAAMSWAVEQGIFQGDGSTYNPQGNASRAEVAVVLARYMQA